MYNLKNANTVTLSDNPWGEAEGGTNSSSIHCYGGCCKLVAPISMPLGILRHIKRFQVIVQQTEAGRPYKKELPVLNEICHMR